MTVSVVDRYVADLRERLDRVAGTMRTVALGHAAQLEQLGPVRVLALDPCPRCDGHVIASTDVARCTRCDYTVGGGTT